MRFKKTEKEKVISRFPFGIAQGRIRNSYSANPLLKIEQGAVTGKIEKETRFGQPGQFDPATLSLQFTEDRRGHIIDIDPGLKACYDNRVS
jgi:hypothetical protein